MHTAKEARASLLGETMESPIFDLDQAHLRWSRFKDFEPERKFNVFKDEVFGSMKNQKKVTKKMTDLFFQAR